MTGLRLQTRSRWFPKKRMREIAKENKRYFDELSITPDRSNDLGDGEGDNYNDDDKEKVYNDIDNACIVLRKAFAIVGLTRGNLTVADKTRQLEETLSKEEKRLQDLVNDMEKKKNGHTELVRQQRDLETQLNKLKDAEEDTSVVQKKFDLATRNVEDAEKRLNEGKTTGRERQKKVEEFITSHVKELEDELATLKKALEDKTENFTIDGMKVTKMGDADFDKFLAENNKHCLAEFERLGCSHASNYFESLTRLEKEVYNESRLMYLVCFSQFHHVMDKVGNIAKLLGQVFKPRLNMGILGVDIFN